jgi:hypothetical protein
MAEVGRVHNRIPPQDAAKISSLSLCDFLNAIPWSSCASDRHHEANLNDDVFPCSDRALTLYGFKVYDGLDNVDLTTA